VSRTSVVIATRNRAPELARTLDRLAALEPPPPVVVVDDASTDETPETVAARRGVELVRLPRRMGASGARNAGVARVGTPYVAFSDDDSWWAPGALAHAERALDGHPAVGLLAASVLVGPSQRPDPVNEELRGSPLGGAEPGPDVLGFLGCAAVVRVAAFRDVGGFDPLLRFGAEESLLAADLTAAGWRVCHHAGLVAHHHPSPHRMPHEDRVALEARNRLLIALMRRPWPRVGAEVGALAGRALGRPASRRALLSALCVAPRALTHRRVLPDRVERALTLLEQR
jgi:glycosyltransferase involved in cell wall biosynthesis